ncbi:cytochrome P450 4c3 [Caerostris darwini]|uniref:Cytochrome P450 4c3 n=1 Tax=Caerostris darwini TaxID=1538125 RepID=A0AAV4P7A3_9ARAC|nr:cytochrome P450 4c3 [Caerostris darwini]
MFFEVVVCVLIGILAVLALLSQWRKKYNRFVHDNKHNVFQVLVDAMDSILFVTSGKKNALHLYIAKYFREKSEIFRQYPFFTQWYFGASCIIIHKGEAIKSKFPVERAKGAPYFQSSMIKGYLTVFNEHAQKLVDFLHEETGKEFTCIESPLSLCALDIVCGELNDAENQV